MVAALGRDPRCSCLVPRQGRLQVPEDLAHVHTTVACGQEALSQGHLVHECLHQAPPEELGVGTEVRKRQFLDLLHAQLRHSRVAAIATTVGEGLPHSPQCWKQGTSALRSLGQMIVEIFAGVSGREVVPRDSGGHYIEGKGSGILKRVAKRPALSAMSCLQQLPQGQHDRMALGSPSALRGAPSPWVGLITCPGLDHCIGGQMAVAT
mmetsp:Transcript_81124/g.224511  ORF Transcript_81124/g.224511 Transcript_81124/m.224511 type:complete len:208 (-) Transcript_81124:15-638(-)